MLYIRQCAKVYELRKYVLLPKLKAFSFFINQLAVIKALISKGESLYLQQMKNKENEYVTQIYIQQPPIIHQPFIVVPPSPMGNYIVHSAFSPHDTDFLKIAYFNDSKQQEAQRIAKNYHQKKIVGVKKSSLQNPYSQKNNMDHSELEINYTNSQRSTSRNGNLGTVEGQCGIVRNCRTQSLFSNKLAEQAKSPPAASGNKNVFAKDTQIQNIVETLKQNIIRDLQEVSKKIMGFNTNDSHFSLSQENSNNQKPYKSQTPSFRTQLNKLNQASAQTTSHFEFEESPVCQKPQRKVQSQLPFKFKECFENIQKEIEEQLEPEEEQINNQDKELTVSSMKAKEQAINISFESFQDEPIKLYNSNTQSKNEGRIQIPLKASVTSSLQNQSLLSAIRDKDRQSILSSQKDKSATDQNLLLPLKKQKEFFLPSTQITIETRKECLIPKTQMQGQNGQLNHKHQLENDFQILSQPILEQTIKNNDKQEFSISNDFNQNNLNLQEPILVIRDRTSVQKQQRMTFGAEGSDEEQKKSSSRQLSKKDRYQIMMENFKSLRSQSGDSQPIIQFDSTPTEVELHPDFDHISDFIIYSNFLRESQSLKGVFESQKNEESREAQKKLVTFQENNFVHESQGSEINQENLVHESQESERTEESVGIPTFNEAQEYNEFFYVNKRYFSGKNAFLPPIRMKERSDKKNKFDRQSSFKDFLKSQSSVCQDDGCKNIFFPSSMIERKRVNERVDLSSEVTNSQIPATKSPQQKALSRQNILMFVQVSLNIKKMQWMKPMSEYFMINK